MKKESDVHIFKGMQRDLDPYKNNPEFLSNAKNIRITNRKEDTEYAITSEKSTKLLNIISKDETFKNSKGILDDILGNSKTSGSYVGHSILNNYFILFTHDENFTINSNKEFCDYIYLLEKSDANYTIEVLYNGNLNFNTNYPLETFSIYENENVQKVYWTDGINQPRVINIKSSKKDSWNNDSFNFIQSLYLKENVAIEKLVGTNGSFPAGALQYVFTYYNKYGQESNIVYQSPLIYTSFSDRAGSPEETVSNSFKISINNFDTNFDYIRIYSIMRTSIDNTPIVKRVSDLEIPKNSNIVSLRYIDNGLNGDNVDPTELLFKGGDNITAKTICQKDGTLFLGGIKLIRENIPDYIKNNIIENSNKNITTKFRTCYNTNNEFSLNGYEYVTFYNNLGTKYSVNHYCNPSTFKRGETYRLGIQFQYKTGKWSEPIFMCDYKIPEINYNDANIYSQSTDNLKLPYISKSINFNNYIDENNNRLKNLIELGYKKVRAVVSFPNIQERQVVTQGILCPTMFNYKSRQHNTPYAQSSWFLRPFPKMALNERSQLYKNGCNGDINNYVQYKHNKTLIGGCGNNAEIAGNFAEFSDLSPNTSDGVSISIWVNNNKSVIDGTNDYVREITTDDRSTITTNISESSNIFAVDQNILNLYSADVEFDTDISNLVLESSNIKLNIIGRYFCTESAGYKNIITSTPTSSSKASGFIDNVNFKYNEEYYNHMAACFCYEDELIDDYSDTSFQPVKPNKKNNNGKDFAHLFNFCIYPWQSNGALNNDVTRPTGAGTTTSELKRNHTLNINKFNKFIIENYDALNSSYIGKVNNLIDIKLFNSDQIDVVKLENNTYYGNFDTLCISPLRYGKFLLQSDDEEIVSKRNTGKYSSNKINFFNINYLEPNSVNSYNTWKSSGVAYSATYPHESFFGDNWEDVLCNKNSVRIKYKVSPHFVFQLGAKKSDGTLSNLSQLQQILQDKYNNLSNVDKNTTVVKRVSMYPYLFVGELIRLNPPTFGGKTQDALKNNIWIPAGDAITINEEGDTEITWKWGDTFYQKYEFFKSYPFTFEDLNSVTEIGSFIGEFRTNADGRYDKNKNAYNNFNVSPKNFNLHNPVYSQSNNFFTYRILDDDYYNINNFPNTITWTLQKNYGSNIDSWTHISMASTLNVDGVKGDITALKVFNNNIYCFQTNGISKILFNDRVQIQASDGVPIEISNNYKVEGNLYISEYLGCSNKLSMCTTASGIYFVDTVTKQLYNLSEGISNISVEKGFSNWFNLQTGVIKLFYDFNNNDLYINTNTECLNYSEKLGNFISFFDYNKAVKLFNIGDKFYAITSKIILSKSSSFDIWEMFADNNPCKLLGKDCDYEISFISNKDAMTTKIFTNVEIMADWRNLENLSDGDGVNFDNKGNKYTFFDSLQISNEYQDSGKKSLNRLRYKASNAKNKFRKWEIELPRDKTNKRNRISNQWAKITLTKDKNNLTDYPMILHNVGVIYYN